MLDLSGTQFDNYRLLHPLGEGNFGQVYMGEKLNAQTAAFVAIKIFRMQLTVKEVPDFLNEARVFRLKHPHIIPITDFGIERSTSTPLLVMQYAPNGTLRQRYPKGTRVPLEKVISYIQQIADALYYAHEEENLIHRDVKPENMLLGANDEVLLCDFGLALVSQTARVSSQVSQDKSGTPFYMAPEQYRGNPGRASDQYALAVIAYEWITGEPPFTGDMFQLMYQHIYKAPPALHEKMPDVAAEIERVVLKALSKDAGQRYANVREFANALEAAYKKTQPGQQKEQMKSKTKEAWIDEGNKLYYAGHYAEALAAYDRALQLAPTYAIADACKGITYRSLKQYQQALAENNRAIELNPHLYIAYYNRGSTYDEMHEFQKALEDYTRAIERNPQ